jgi:hypothetical protein
MCPQYLWACLDCGEEIHIFRNMSESDSRPTSEDLEWPAGDCEHVNWQKLIPRTSFMSTERHLSKSEMAKQNPLIEAVKLEKKVASMDPKSEASREMKKEIKYLKSTGGPKS